ncbi:hypothetical protein P4112_06470 [Pseudomonas aeruginosa]|nr:hypothetical protein [Pseudomonas aeruginosa]
MAKSETALYFTNVIAIGPQEALLAGHLYLEGAEPSVTRVMMIDQDDWFPSTISPKSSTAPCRGVRGAGSRKVTTASWDAPACCVNTRPGSPARMPRWTSTTST